MVPSRRVEVTLKETLADPVLKIWVTFMATGLKHGGYIKKKKKKKKKTGRRIEKKKIKKI